MLIKGIIVEDFVNYKLPSMTIEFPYCTFKCGREFCQNSAIVEESNIEISEKRICEMYINNPITEAVVFQGMEPFDSPDELLELVKVLREKTNDPIVIYSGYNKDEIVDWVKALKKYKNIIIKFGRYIPNQTFIYDEILGVTLASDNQYAEKIS